MLEKITHLAYYLFKAKKSGLLKTKKDKRNFNFGLFGFQEYTPKSSKKIIKTLSVKDQKFLNTCVFNACTVQKEVDEGVELSVKTLVNYANRAGYISGDGFSSLINGQKTLKDFGAGDLKNYNNNIDIFEKYANDFNYSKMVDDASEHKSKTYWEISSRNEILKLIDDGKVLTCGMDWFTGFNQGGGFAYPFLITRNVGYKVGGHSVAIIGYDLNYQGKKVYVIQNSYSDKWGDNGKFYVDMDYFDRYCLNTYGVFANLDIDSPLGDFLIKYEGKNVKTEGSQAIYRLQGGKKKPYPNELAYIVYNETPIFNFELVDKELLDKVPVGDIMDIKKSMHWEVLKTLSKPYNYNQLIQALKI